MDVLSILSSILQTLLLSPLLFIFHIISTVFLPVTVIIHQVSHVLSLFVYLPFALLSRLQVSHRGGYSYPSAYWGLPIAHTSQAVYIFCGTAAIIGVLTGTLLGITIHVFTGAFGLRDKLDLDITSHASPTTSFIPSRNRPSKRTPPSTSTKSTHGQQPHPPASRMLFPPSIPTILEEEDEDSSFLPGNQVGRQRSKRGGLDALWAVASDNSSDL